MSKPIPANKQLTIWPKYMPKLSKPIPANKQGHKLAKYQACYLSCQIRAANTGSQAQQCPDWAPDQTTDKLSEVPYQCLKGTPGKQTLDMSTTAHTGHSYMLAGRMNIMCHFNLCCISNLLKVPKLE